MNLTELRETAEKALRSFERQPKAMWSDHTYLCPKDAKAISFLLAALEEAEKALADLIAHHDSWMACNDGFMGNQADAYYHIAKKFADWDAARLALSKIRGTIA